MPARARRRRFGVVAVAGASMTPTLLPGDFLLVRYGAAVRRGDIVVVRLPGRPVAVKRALYPVGDGWWVQGDAPRASTDSRTLGPVPAGAVLGRVVLRYWPVVRRRERAAGAGPPPDNRVA